MRVRRPFRRPIRWLFLRPAGSHPWGDFFVSFPCPACANCRPACQLFRLRQGWWPGGGRPLQGVDRTVPVHLSQDPPPLGQAFERR